MKITKNQVSNIVLLLFLAAVLFTPAGTKVKVLFNRLLAFSPSVVKIEDRKHLDDYNWRLKNREGEPYNFETSKGKVILVNLWATWCPPCIVEMPSMQSLYNDYGNRVEFIFVTNDDKATVDGFLKKNNYKFPVYFETSAIPEVLYSRSIPATYLISKSGEIVIEKKGAANWNSKEVRQTIDLLLK